MAQGQDEGWSSSQLDHDRSVRRRWTAIAVILAVAMAGALLGHMSVVRNDSARPVPPGPFGGTSP